MQSVRFVFRTICPPLIKAVRTICLPYGLSKANQSVQFVSVRFVRSPYDLSSVRFVCRPNSSTRRLYTKHQTDLILENVFQNLDFCSDPKIGNEVSNVIFTHWDSQTGTLWYQPPVALIPIPILKPTPILTRYHPISNIQNVNVLRIEIHRLGGRLWY